MSRRVHPPHTAAHVRCDACDACLACREAHTAHCVDGPIARYQREKAAAKARGACVLSTAAERRKQATPAGTIINPQVIAAKQRYDQMSADNRRRPVVQKQQPNPLSSTE